MQIESRISSLLEYYAEMQLIFYKDNEHFGTGHTSSPTFFHPLHPKRRQKGANVNKIH